MIVVYVDSMEPGAMAALPAQPKSALFQDSRIRPSRLEPSTLRSARSWAFCFFSIWPKSTFLCLYAHSSLRSLVEVFCRCTMFIQKEIQHIESSSSIPEESEFLLCGLCLDSWTRTKNLVPSIPLKVEIFHVCAFFCLFLGYHTYK